MKKIGDIQCTGCSACYDICPNSAISIKNNKDGFFYPIIDYTKCIKCRLCEKVCPLMNNNLKRLMNGNGVIKAYAVKTKKFDVQINSTSGGLFTEIAKKVISDGGVAYGATFSDDWMVHHIRAITLSDVKKLAKSKYVQSSVTGIYRAVKNDLDKDIIVVFSGTQCQIGGLKGYLGKNYDNLYLIDIICHGIPSPGIWGYYVKALIEKYGSKIARVVQKDKDIGGWKWNKQFLKIDFENGSTLKECIWNNSYMLGFLGDLFLRQSCYKCPYKNFVMNGVSDIMIGDYWGCENIEPDFYDANGVSVALINTLKGEKLLNSIKDIDIKQTNIARVLAGNVAVFPTYFDQKARNKFWDIFDVSMSLNQFAKLVESCINISKKEKRKLLFRIKRKLYIMFCHFHNNSF